RRDDGRRRRLRLLERLPGRLRGVPQLHLVEGMAGEVRGGVPDHPRLAGGTGGSHRPLAHPADGGVRRGPLRRTVAGHRAGSERRQRAEHERRRDARRSGRPREARGQGHRRGGEGLSGTMTDIQAPVSPVVPESSVRTGAGDPPAPVRRRRADWRKRGEIALLTGPALIMFLGFVIFPVMMAAFYGFFRWNGFGWPTEFVGLDNYLLMWRDETFRDAVLHNFIIVVLSLVMQGPIAILFALLLNQKIRGRSVIRVLIFMPYVISVDIVGIVWSLMMQDARALNFILENWGLTDLQQSWLADPLIAMWTLMVT